MATGVSPDAGAENSQRKLVADAAGRLYLAYSRPVQGLSQIFLAISRDRGRTWRHQQVSTTSGVPSRLASVAVFPDGALHVVWTAYAPVGSVRHRVLRDDRWSPEETLSDVGVYAGVPSIAPVAGQPHVLWYGIRPERPNVPTRHGSIYEILATHKEGARWSTPQVISPGVPDSINPALDAAAGGRLQAAWFQFDGRGYQIRVARYDGAWALPQTLTAGTIDHTRVALAVAGAATHLVWEEGAQVPAVVYRRLDGPATQRLSGAGAARTPVIAGGGGRVAAAWQQGAAIVVRVLQPAGQPRVIGAGQLPALAISGPAVYLAWTDVAGGTPVLRVLSLPLP